MGLTSDFETLIGLYLTEFFYLLFWVDLENLSSWSPPVSMKKLLGSLASGLCSFFFESDYLPDSRRNSCFLLAWLFYFLDESLNYG